MEWEEIRSLGPGSAALPLSLSTFTSSSSFLYSTGHISPILLITAFHILPINLLVIWQADISKCSVHPTLQQS